MRSIVAESGFQTWLVGTGWIALVASEGSQPFLVEEA